MLQIPTLSIEAVKCVRKMKEGDSHRPQEPQLPPFSVETFRVAMMPIPIHQAAFRKAPFLCLHVASSSPRRVGCAGGQMGQMLEKQGAAAASL